MSGSARLLRGCRGIGISIRDSLLQFLPIRPERLSALPGDFPLLRLHRLETELPTLLEQAAKRDVPYSDFLDELLALEIRSKAEKHLTMRVSMARFPFQKSLDAFDFKFQPSIDPKVIRELATGRYLESGDNVLLLGPPGVGKTHLAVALGLKACEHGVRVLLMEPAYTRTGFDANALQADAPLPIYAEQRQAFDRVMASAMEVGDDPATVARSIVAAATDPRPKLRYTAGSTAGRVSALRRFVPAWAFDRQIRKLNRLPA